MSVVDTLSRRRFLAAAAGLVGGLVGSGLPGVADASRGTARLGPQTPGLPRGQHQWAAALARDAHGNSISPRFDRLLFFDVVGRPTEAHVRALEAALRALERAHVWGPDGLLFTDLKDLCSLTDGNLSRHLGVLQDAGVVDVKKSFNGNRPQTWCKLTAAGRKRFADYVTALEKVVSDAVALDAPRKRNASPGLNLA